MPFEGKKRKKKKERRGGSPGTPLFSDCPPSMAQKKTAFSASSRASSRKVLSHLKYRFPLFTSPETPAASPAKRRDGTLAVGEPTPSPEGFPLLSPELMTAFAQFVAANTGKKEKSETTPPKRQVSVSGGVLY